MIRIAIITVGCFLAGNSFGQQPFFQQFDIGAGTKMISLNVVVQDPYGLMWIGSSNGLYTFNGSDFKKELLHDSSSAVITALYCDSNFIWIGDQKGNIMYRPLAMRNRNVELDTSLGAPIIRIAGNREGIYFATYGKGLFIKSNDRWFQTSSKDGLPTDEIYSLAEAGNTIWIGTDGGLTKCFFSNGKWQLTTYGRESGLPDEIVKSIVADDEGRLLLGTFGKGICLFDPAKQMFSMLPCSYDWKYGNIKTMALQSGRRLLVGTSDAGIVSVSIQAGYHVSILNEASGYKDIKVLDLTIDSEGNFWAATANNTLDQFPALFEWIDVGFKGIQSVLFDSKNNLWFATIDGLFRIMMDSTSRMKVTRVPLSSGKSPFITTMYEDKAGNIWIGTFEDGVYYRRSVNANFLNIRMANGLLNNNILSISGNSNEIWISTLGGAARCYLKSYDDVSQMEFKNFSEASGLHSSYIYQAMPDSTGHVWFATDGSGLKVFNGQTFQTIDRVDSIPIKTVYSLTKDGTGNIWFSTPSRGLFRYDLKNFFHYDENSDISDFNIAGIVADRNNDILILENDGFEILESHSNQIRRYRGRPYFEDLSPNLNAYSKDRFGNIWIATQKGILKYYPPEEDYSHQARLQLSQVLTFLQSVELLNGQQFKFNRNHLTFEYQGFWNYNPALINYRYKLDGYDLDWIETKDERVIYPKLPPGNYTFMVQATIHHNFEEPAIASFQFEILSPFWMTWWFIGSCLVAFVSLIYFFINLREKQIEKEEKLKRERIEFQLENLKTQINPHFLFNSFNTLATLIDEDQSIAVSYVNHLSDFFRSILKYKDIDLIPVKEECDLVKNFVFLLKQRHGNALQIKDGISEEAKTSLIPPLTLQLLIENAVKHNIVSKSDPLTILISSQNSSLTVRNNLQRRKEAVNSTRIGLQNISSRFELLGGKPVEIIENEKYFEVHLTLFKNDET